MIKLLIVEDEERTRQILTNHIPWTEIGIDEVNSAKNGLIALELSKEWRPDIVLCDVRMPKMDGIEFAKRLREFDKECEIIFLSGHSDKEYLKSAISLKAFNYIEKPINIEEIKTVVSLAQANRRDQQIRRSMELKLKDSFLESLPLLRQELVKEWMRENPDLTAIRSRFDSLAVSLPVKGIYTVAAIAFNWHPAFTEGEREMIRFHIVRMMNTEWEDQENRLICGFVRTDTLAVIMDGVYSHSYKENRELLERMHSGLQSRLEGRGSIAIGVSVPVEDLGQCYKAFRGAENAACMGFYAKGTQRLFFEIEQGVSEKFEVKRTELHQFKNALNKGDFDQASRMVGRWGHTAALCRDPLLLRVKNFFFDAALVLFEVAAEYNRIDAADDQERSLLWLEFEQMHTLAQVAGYLSRNIESMLTRSTEASVNRKVQEIMKFIQNHYSDKNLSIQAIADHVGLSETYLCSLFKKSKGFTVKEFISEVRIEQAKALLHNGDIKLYEVALRIGISDPNYFTTFFKKSTGITPSEFKERAGSL